MQEKQYKSITVSDRYFPPSEMTCEGIWLLSGSGNYDEPAAQLFGLALSFMNQQLLKFFHRIRILEKLQNILLCMCERKATKLLVSIASNLAAFYCDFV